MKMIQNSPIIMETCTIRHIMDVMYHLFHREPQLEEQRGPRWRAGRRVSGRWVVKEHLVPWSCERNQQWLWANPVQWLELLLLPHKQVTNSSIYCALSPFSLKSVALYILLLVFFLTKLHGIGKSIQPNHLQLWQQPHVAISQLSETIWIFFSIGQGVA